MADNESNPREVQLIVTDEGRYLLDGLDVELSELGGRLRVLKAQNVELRVMGSGMVRYEALAPAMKVVQEEGMVRLSFLGGATPTSAPSGTALG
jgi:biopolymer transport protein ExbD